MSIHEPAQDSTLFQTLKPVLKWTRKVASSIGKGIAQTARWLNKGGTGLAKHLEALKRERSENGAAADNEYDILSIPDELTLEGIGQLAKLDPKDKILFENVTDVTTELRDNLSTLFQKITASTKTQPESAQILHARKIHSPRINQKINSFQEATTTTPPATRQATATMAQTSMHLQTFPLTFCRRPRASVA